MEPLTHYASAILGHAGPHTIVSQTTHQERWQDQGIETWKVATTYHFSNGAIINRTVEQDNLPSELACAECWISYDVVDAGVATAIQPQRKTFDNACREAFWLSYHQATPSR